MLVNAAPLPTVEDAPEADYPEAWADYYSHQASPLTVRYGESGRCRACGRFKTKNVTRFGDFPPTLIDGQVCFDAGYEEIRFTCTDC